MVEETDKAKKKRFLGYLSCVCESLEETYHDCILCRQAIFYGDEYRNGGPGNRAHQWCIENRLVDENSRFKVRGKRILVRKGR